LAGLVQDQEVTEFVAEDGLRPLLLEHPVGDAGRDRDDRPLMLLYAERDLALAAKVAIEIG
jgi:hypothetical protein